MVSVLKTVSRVDEVGSGISNSDGWIHPFVEYRHQEKEGQKGTIRFEARRSNDWKHPHDVYFLANLGGMHGSEESGPNDQGTTEIAKKWQVKCGVSATVMYW